jgi:hypothetical protein
MKEITINERENQGTKKYFNSSMNSQITKEDIYAYIAIILTMGIKHYPDMEMHWNKEPFLADSFIPSIMNKSRFSTIKRGFHISDDNTHIFGKIDSLITHVNKISQTIYIPQQEFAIDEH